ncbi:SRPBCC family protein [Marinoscillum furvescens]|uniref:Uncharacterized protein YndB with AHSA1/START domain n=1 Tax=Marinoscillum furvescens DSM 4134 TaxID=1122208 RepID=A0A3D9L2S1_MARFU|nr:SRPBCC domain-containing protein [Marinoscillum furvescens]RED99416.1 uncharacterized protein YndB with AHSA1/START domain [Marinoscillum furvescens DSM 4134]
MANKTWSSFTRKIIIHATPEHIYPQWATSAGIEKWFLRSCTYISASGTTRKPDELVQASDQFSWKWHNWPDEEKGKILTANHPTELTWTFAGSQVTLHLEAREESTLVTLTQELIPTDDKSKMNIYYGCGTGWTFWLTNLKAYLEHKITLHHKNPDMMGKHDGFEFVNM